MAPKAPKADADKSDLTDWLILRFKQLISEGTLTPGYKLPSERELSLHFGVSRTSLRPVMKVLSMMGVVTQRVGDGTYLSSDASSVLAEPMEFLFLLDETSSKELIEARFMVEPALAAKAAEQATPELLLIMRQTIAEIEAAGTDQFRIIEADLLFHRTIHQCAGNRLFSRLFQVIHRSMMNMMMLTSQMVDRDHTLAFHQAIYEAIARGNGAEAARHMRDHLIDARALLMQASQAHADERLRRRISSVTRTTGTKKRAATGTGRAGRTGKS
ncbi:FadR/GntR family transcriptional regulator [Paracidobacterium acidisoli]|uniref:FadR family transcriptional regulator n=1 Tax=Paracidobacterium acidisoli TaxID=2303751 RepID=A0A372IQX3_9BACT|nr:FadR/GntR family transcriptional regulator [Paracidobacterium acidisoli]MBT9331548.1 FadR family transcriptional regulator [Paracidobacterium acidisoli]